MAITISGASILSGRRLGWPRSQMPAAEIYRKASFLYRELHQSLCHNNKEQGVEAVEHFGINFNETGFWGRVFHRFLSHYKNLEVADHLLSSMFAAINGEYTREDHRQFFERQEQAAKIICNLAFVYPPDMTATIISNINDLEVALCVLMNRARENFPDVLTVLTNDSFIKEKAFRILEELAEDRHKPGRAFAKNLLELMPRDKAGAILSAHGPSSYLQMVIGALDDLIWTEIKAEINPVMLAKYLYRD